MRKIVLSLPFLLVSLPLRAAETTTAEHRHVRVAGYTYVSAFGELETKGIGMRMLRDLSDQVDLVVGATHGKSRGNGMTSDNADYVIGALFMQDRSKSSWYGGAHAGLQSQRIEVKFFENQITLKRLNAVLLGEVGYRREIVKNVTASVHLNHYVSSYTLAEQSSGIDSYSFTDNFLSTLLGVGAAYSF